MKNDRIRFGLILAVAMSASASALAMPTKDELAKAQPLVAELMADDVAAYKAKSKKAEDIGDISIKYAQEASTEAAKFLLLKGAKASVCLELSMVVGGVILMRSIRVIAGLNFWLKEGMCGMMIASYESSSAPTS